MRAKKGFSALKLLRRVKARLRSRADTEHVMSANRLLFGLLMSGYVAIVLPHLALTALAIAVVTLVVTAGTFLHILLGPARSVERRTVALLADIGTISYVLHLGGGATSCFFPLLLWTIFGNGIRFGWRSLLRATAVATASFAVVIATTPFWRHNPPLAAGLLLGLGTLPLYTLSLLKRLNAAKQQAEAANHAKSLFLASVSHELRTPLHAILGMGTLLQRVKLPPESAEMTRTIVEAGSTLLELIDDVLKLSRLEASEVTVLDVEFDVLTLLMDVRGLIWAQAQEKGLKLALHAAPHTPARVSGDRRHLKEILLNLASNALKFTESGGILLTVGAVEPAPLGQRLRFEVIDTGIGIEPEAQGRVFEKFTQADPSIAERFGGTGLGLSICKHLVEALGGQIGLASRLGEGSTFWVELPCAEVSGAAAADAVPPGPLTVLGIDAPVQSALRDAVQAAWTGDVALTECRSTAIEPHLRAAASAEGFLLVAQPATPPAARALAAAIAAASPADLPRLAIAGEPPPGRDFPDLRWTVPTRLPAAFDQAGLQAALGIARTLAGTAPGRTEAPSAERLPAAGPAEESRLPPPSRRRLSILIVDDNRVNQKVTAKILESGGHSYQVAGDGNAALDALEAGEFDLVLMDANMPGLDGIEATKLYRFASLGQPRLPILGVTADASPGMAERCKDAGMDGVLVKPVKADALLAVIEASVPEQVVSRLPNAKAGPPSLRVVQTPMLDPQHMASLRELGGDEFVADVLSGFLADAQQISAELTRAADALEIAKFKTSAHALASGAANVGASRLRSLGLSLERMREGELRLNGRRKAREISAELDDLARELANTRKRSEA